MSSNNTTTSSKSGCHDFLSLFGQRSYFRTYNLLVLWIVRGHLRTETSSCYHMIISTHVQSGTAQPSAAQHRVKPMLDPPSTNSTVNKTAVDDKQPSTGAHTTSSLQWSVLKVLLDAVSQFERRLPTKLDDDALRPLLLDHIQHILYGQGLKVQPAAGVIVCGNSLRVAIHHDGLIAISPAPY